MSALLAAAGWLILTALAALAALDLIPTRAWEAPVRWLPRPAVAAALALLGWALLVAAAYR